MNIKNDPNVQIKTKNVQVDKSKKVEKTEKKK